MISISIYCPFFLLMLLVAITALSIQGRSISNGGNVSEDANDETGKFSVAIKDCQNNSTTTGTALQPHPHLCHANGTQGRKRRETTGWLATLTESERGGLDTILVRNLGLSPSVTDHLTELDIVKDSQQGVRKRKKKKRHAVRSTSKLWPEGVVPYEISPSMSTAMRNLILGAMKEYEHLTCLRFVSRQDTDGDYILFTPGSGCSSPVGRQGNRQIISLEEYCGHGVIIHEIAHSIGIYHEHTRPDRDEYVRIVWQNVDPSKESQFDMQRSEDVDTLGVSYDYDSIMHYSKLAFSRFGGITIVPLMEGVYELGQKVRLSPKDIQQVNRLYSCGSNMESNYEVSFDHLQHTHFTGQSFFIEDLNGAKCLSAPSTRDFDPRLIRYHNHRGLYPVVTVDCDRQSSSQLWHKSKHFIVHVDTHLCLGLLFERGLPEAKVVLQTCKDNDVDQIWYCSGNVIREAFNVSCLASGGHQSRKKREVDSFVPPVFRSKYDDKQGRGIHPRSTGNIDMAALETCSSDNERIQWRLSDSSGIDDHNTICSRDPYAPRRCYPADMHPATRPGLKRIRCNSPGHFATGFFHTYNFEDSNDRNNRNSGLISALKCCTDEMETGVGEELCYQINWWDGSSQGSIHMITKGWVFCPHGMYLKGLSLETADFNVNMNIIVDVECCRRAGVGGEERVLYKHCYEDSTTEVLDTMVHACSLDGYYIAGVERKNCNEDKIECEEVIICCK